MSAVDDYRAFLAGKAVRATARGLDEMPALAPHLFDYQAHCVAFALRLGSSGLYLSTGLGKTACELEWCRHAAEASNGRALILTPLAVARQIEREGQRWGYDCRVIREQAEAREGINICNYDRLDRLDPAAFGAVAADEAGIIKNFSGKTTRAMIEAFGRHRWRLAATATPAPNDHMELGQQSEFLGILAGNEMLSRWFINDTSTASQLWRLKKHAEADFWDWMASWSRMAELPDDLGFDASRFVLPPLRVIRHAVAGRIKSEAGTLFAADVSATSIFDVKRQTSAARADMIARLVAAEPREPWLIWCDTDDEADALLARIPAAIDVRGSHPVERKEDGLAAFVECGGTLVTKPSVAGWGMNFQHCARVAFVGRTFSYEQWFQAVRRCWRFGQTRTVDVHLAVAEGEEQIGRVLDRKADDHARMVAAMRQAMRRDRGREAARKVTYAPTHDGRMPAWL